MWGIHIQRYFKAADCRKLHKNRFIFSPSFLLTFQDDSKTQEAECAKKLQKQMKFFSVSLLFHFLSKESRVLHINLLQNNRKRLRQAKHDDFQKFIFFFLNFLYELILFSFQFLLLIWIESIEDEWNWMHWNVNGKFFGRK